TEFLVVAATLLELKAARLLPAPDADPDEVEAIVEERDLLFARRLQYRAYKQVAGLFGARLAEQAAHHPRRVGAEDLLRRIVPELLVGVTPDELDPAAAARGRSALRAAVPPPRRPHRRRHRPARRPGAVQAIAGRARPELHLRRHHRPLDRRRTGRPHRPHGRRARMTPPPPPPPTARGPP